MPKVVDRLFSSVNKLKPKNKDAEGKDKAEHEKKDLWETKKHQEMLQSKSLDKLSRKELVELVELLRRQKGCLEKQVANLEKNEQKQVERFDLMKTKLVLALEEKQYIREQMKALSTENFHPPAKVVTNSAPASPSKDLNSKIKDWEQKYNLLANRMREFNLEFQTTTQQLQVEKKKNQALEQEKEVLESKIQKVLQSSTPQESPSFESISPASPIQERIGNLIEDLDKTLQQLQKEKPSSDNDQLVSSHCKQVLYEGDARISKQIRAPYVTVFLALFCLFLFVK